MTLLYLLLLLPIFWILGKSANLTTRAIVDIAKIIGLSDLTIGFVILGLATSTPELLVGINSALGGTPELSFGNLVGANIVLLSFVVGLSAILNNGIHLRDRIERRTIHASSLLVLIPLVLALDGIVSRLDGVVMVAVYAMYLTAVVLKRHTLSIARPFARHDVRSTTLWIWFGTGVIGLLVGSKLVVMLAIELSVGWNIAPIIIGFLLLSFGTNLPEIFITIKNRNSEHNHIAFGNVIGSAVVNTLILGIVAIIHPIVVSDLRFLLTGMAFLVAVAITLNIFLKTKDTLSRTEGVVLLMIYIFFIVTQGMNR